MSRAPAHFRTVLRQYAGMAPWLRVPAEVVRGWGLERTTTVEGTIDGQPIGRRAIKDSGPKSDDWYLALTKPLAERIGKAAGEEVEVELHLADMTMPHGLAARIAGDPDFARAWQALAEHHRRKVVEACLAPRTEAGRAAALERVARGIEERLASRGDGGSGARKPVR